MKTCPLCFGASCPKATDWSLACFKDRRIHPTSLASVPEADQLEVVPEGQEGPSEAGEPQAAAYPVQEDPYPLLDQEADHQDQVPPSSWVERQGPGRRDRP